MLALWKPLICGTDMSRVYDPDKVARVVHPDFLNDSGARNFLPQRPVYPLSTSAPRDVLHLFPTRRWSDDDVRPAHPCLDFHRRTSTGTHSVDAPSPMIVTLQILD